MPMTEYAEAGTAIADPVDTNSQAPTTAEPSFLMLPHTLIVPSLTNPRKSFDPAKLAELAASIAASGMHQPVLVRPLPESRLQDTFRDRRPGQPLPTHELVAGERRLRACKIAGVPELPCMVKHLTDNQVLEVQIVENLQRDDLSELEEAEGYATLVAATGIAKEDIGERIGRSRTYVYGRLKLLDLCPPAREALREGKIDASRALLIARIPNDKLQIKALKEFCAKDFAGDTRMGHRAALVWIKQNVMLKLADARFDIDSVDLVPEAGSCATCPKRTGHDPDLFSDVDAPDLCTDTTCFNGKQTAHTAVITAKARARGMEVIEGKEAQELKPHHYSGDPDGLTRLDTRIYNPDPNVEDCTLREHLSKSEIRDQVKLFVDPHTGEAVEVVPDTLANQVRQHMRQATRKPTPEQQQADEQTEREEAQYKLAREYEKRWRIPAVEAIERGLQAGMVQSFDAAMLRAVLAMLVTHDEVDGDICSELLQVPKEVDLFDEGVIDAAIKAIPDELLGVRVCTLLLHHERVPAGYWRAGKADKDATPVIDALAATCQVNLQAIKDQVQAEIRDEHEPEPEPVKKGKRAAKKAVATTPEDALAAVTGEPV